MPLVAYLRRCLLDRLRLRDRSAPRAVPGPARQWRGLEPLEPRLLLHGDPFVVAALDEFDDGAAAVHVKIEPLDDPSTVFTPDRPVLLVPGIVGNFATVDFVTDWFTTRGIAPEIEVVTDTGPQLKATIEIDPLAGYYNDILATLTNVGYVLNKNLFVVNYDWRLPVGPAPDLEAGDTFDGTLHVGGASAITDDAFRYGVDYFGHSLRQAAETWRTLTGEPLKAIDVITHSTGGLVARAYIQSDAYGGVYDMDAGHVLPQVNDLVMVGVPNRGASKPWNALHDNFASDFAYRVVISKIGFQAYTLLADDNGIDAIAGPDHTITLEEILDPGTGAPDFEAFISLYVPTIQGLLATYPFLIDDASVDGQPRHINHDTNPVIRQNRNDVLLDLNAGLDHDWFLDDPAVVDPETGLLREGFDPSPFIDLLYTEPVTGDLGQAINIFSGDVKTASLAQQRQGMGTDALRLPPLVSMSGYVGRFPTADEMWFEDIYHPDRPLNGDGTVPLESSIGQFAVDPRFHGEHTQSPRGVLRRIDPGGEHDAFSIDHTGLMGHPEAQRIILDHLVGAGNYDPAAIATGLALSEIEALMSLIERGVFDHLDMTALGATAPVVPLLEGLEWLEIRAAAFDASDAMNVRVPLLGQPLRELVNFEAIVRQQLIEPIMAVVETPGVAIEDLTYWHLVEALSANGRTLYDLAIAGVEAVDDVGALVRMPVPMHHRTSVEAPLDLGVLSELLPGLHIDSSTSVTVQVELAMDMVLGLDTRAGVATGERVFIQPGPLEVAAVARVAGVNMAMNLGLVEAVIDGGALDLGALFHTHWHNPLAPGDDRVFLAGDAQLVPHEPGFDGRATLTLPVRLETNLLGSAHPADPVITIDWDFAGAPTVTANDDAMGLLDYRELDFDVIAATLQAVVELLEQVEGLAFLGEPVPMVGMPLGEVIGVSADVANRVQHIIDDPTATLDELEARFLEVFGLDPDAIEMVLEPGMLRFDISQQRSASRSIGLDLRLDELLANATNDDTPQLDQIVGLFDLSAQASIIADVLAMLDLHFGVDLSDPVNPTPVIFDTTGINALARVTHDGDGFDALLSILGASIGISGGQLHFGNGEGSFAHVDVALDGAGAGAGAIADVLANLADHVQFSELPPKLGGTATLPLTLGGQPVGALHIEAKDLFTPDQSIRVTGPDLDALLDALSDLDYLALLTDALDHMLGRLQDYLADRLLNEPLPLIGKSLADVARAIDDVRAALEPVRQMLEEPEGTLESVIAAAEAKIVELLGDQGLGILEDVEDILHHTQDELLFSASLRLGDTVDLALAMGPQQDIGIALAADASAQAQVVLGIDVEFGFDLSAGVALDERFFVRDASAQLGFDVTGAAFNAAVGIAAARIEDAELSLALSVSNLPLAPGTDVTIDVEPVSAFSASLPMSVMLGDFTAPGAPRLVMASDDVFDPDALSITFEDFDELHALRQAMAGDLVAVFSLVRSTLDRVGDRAMNQTVPLVDITVGELLDLGETLTEQVIQPLIDGEGLPRFLTADEMIDRLARAAGVDPDALALAYDPATAQLELAVHVAAVLEPIVGRFALDLDGGPVGELTSQAAVALGGSLDASMRVGLDLASREVLLVGGAPAPADGRLSGSSTFRLRLNGREPVEVVVAPDAGNNSPQDLADDFNAALTEAGLSDDVEAMLTDDGHLSLRHREPWLGAAMSVRVDDVGDPLIAQLHFTDGQNVGDALSQRVTLDDVHLAGGLELTADNLSAFARLGFVGVRATGGTASLAGSFNMALHDPDTGAPGPMTLGDLTRHARNRPLELVAGPDLAGEAALVLPLRLDPNLLGDNHPDNPVLEMNWSLADGGPPTITINDDLTRLLELEHVSFDTIVAAVRELLALLEALEGFDLFDRELPLIGVSAAELVGAGADALERFDRLVDDAADALDQLEGVMRRTLGIDDEQELLTLAWEPGVLRFGIELQHAAAANAQLDVDLVQLLADAVDAPAMTAAARLFDTSGKGVITAEVDATLALHFGLDLSDPLNPVPIVFDETGVRLGARLDAEDLDATLAFLGLRVGVENGGVHLGDGTGDFAQFSVTLDGQRSGNEPVAHGVDDLIASIADHAVFDIKAGASAHLPLVLGNQNLDPLVIDITNLFTDQQSVAVTGPDLDALIDQLSMLDYAGMLADGLDHLFAQLEDFLRREVFHRPLPVIGTSLADAAAFISDMRDAIATVRELIDGTDDMIDTVEQKLRDALEPWLRNDDILDLRTADRVTMTLELGHELDNGAPIALPIGFDVGLPALGLEVDGQIEMGLEWLIDLTIGIDRELGFFIEPTEELLGLSPFVTLDGFQATGRLGFLRVEVIDQGSGLSLDLDVALAAPPGYELITFDALRQAPLSEIVLPTLEGAATIDLVLDLSARDALQRAHFPTLTANLVVDWTVDFAEPELLPPTVSFNDVTLDAGEFASGFVAPILERIQGFIEPIQPLIDFVTTPLPLISDVVGEPVDLLWLAARFGDMDDAFIRAVLGAADLIKSLPDLEDGLVIEFGSFTFGPEHDLRELDDLSGLTLDPDDFVLPELPTDLAGFLDEAATSPSLRSERQAAGIQFPLLSEPQRLFGLLFGQDVELFTWDIPPLGFDFPFSMDFPVFPSVAIELAGGVGGWIDIAFGYDTRGLRQFADTGQAIDLANGFFVFDPLDPAGGSGRVPVAGIDGRITAGAKVGAGALSVGARGGVFAELSAGLRDTNRDGKVHVDEFLENLQHGLNCAIVLDAAVIIGLEAFAGPLSYRFAEIDLAQDALADLLGHCFDGRLEPNDTIAEAAHLGSGPGLHIHGVAIVHEADEDWFRFDLPRDDSIQIDLLFNHALGNLDLAVHGADGQLLARSASKDDNERMVLNDLPAGEYLVHVRGEPNNYALHITPAPSSTTTVYYVNATSDSAFNASEHSFYALAGGDDDHDGTTPHTPTRTLTALLAQHTLGSGDIVTFATGDYEGPLLLDQLAGVSFFGTPDGSQFTDLVIDHADDLVIDRLAFHGADFVDYLGAHLGSATDAITIRNSRFEFLATPAEFPITSPAGIRIDGDGTHTIEGNVIATASFGVALFDAATATIEGNEIINIHTIVDGHDTVAPSAGHGIDVHDDAHALAVTGNTIRGWATGIAASGRVGAVRGNTIAHNDVGIDIDSATLSPAAQAFARYQTIHLPAGAVDTDTLAPLLTVMAAGDTAPAPNTLLVVPGDRVFDEPLVVHLVEGVILNLPELMGAVYADMPQEGLLIGLDVAHHLGGDAFTDDQLAGLPPRDHDGPLRTDDAHLLLAMDIRNDLFLEQMSELVDGSGVRVDPALVRVAIDAAVYFGDETFTLEGPAVATARATHVAANEIHDNRIGVRGAMIVGGPTWDHANQFTDNRDIAIDAPAGSEVSFNRIECSSVGIRTTGGLDAHHNVIHRQGHLAADERFDLFAAFGGAIPHLPAVQQILADMQTAAGPAITPAGVLVESSMITAIDFFLGPDGQTRMLLPGVTLAHNTILADAGDAIRSELAASVTGLGAGLSQQQLTLRNNILWAQNGAALQFDPQVAVVLDSDYNNLYRSDDAVLVQIGDRAIVDLYHWQVDFEQDRHSIGFTPADPLRDQPRFRNVAQDDYRLTPGESTGIAAGDPASDFSREPARHGGRANLGAYGNTPLAAPAATSVLRLIHPELYTDWDADRTGTIAWHAHHVTGDVRLEVIDVATGDVTHITDVAADAGAYVWSPTDSGIAGDSSQRYRLRISSVDAPTLIAESRESFAVPTPGHEFYVSGAGDHRNTGRMPGDPKASIHGALDAGAGAHAGDVIHLAPGAHALHRNVVITADHAGLRITGATNPGVTTVERHRSHLVHAPTDLHWPEPNWGVFELRGADDVVLEHMTLTGGVFGMGFGVRIDIPEVRTSSVVDDDPTPGSDHVRLRHLTIRDAITGVVANDFGRDLRLERSTFDGRRPELNASSLFEWVVPVSDWPWLALLGGFEQINDALDEMGHEPLPVPPDFGDFGELLDWLESLPQIALRLPLHTTTGIDVKHMRDVRIDDNDLIGFSHHAIDIGLAPGFRVVGNRVSESVTGIRAFGAVLEVPGVVEGNDVFANELGLVVEDAIARANAVRDNDIGMHVLPAGRVEGNDVFANRFGIIALTEPDVFDPIDERARVVGNRVFNNIRTGIVGAGDVTISGNRVYSNAVGIDLPEVFNLIQFLRDPDLDALDDNGLPPEFPFVGIVENNLVYAHAEAGVRATAASDFALDWLRDGPRAINNTIYEPSVDALTLAEAPGWRVFNNILVTGIGTALRVEGEATHALESDRNLLHVQHPDGLLASWDGAAVTTLETWQELTGLDAESRAGDPLFVDPAGADGVLGYDADSDVDGGLDDDFRIAPNSPAIDHGRALFAPQRDIDGRERFDDPDTDTTGPIESYGVEALAHSAFTEAGTLVSLFLHQMDLPFAFPFFGRTWDHITLTPMGTIEFGIGDLEDIFEDFDDSDDVDDFDDFDDFDFDFDFDDPDLLTLLMLAGLMAELFEDGASEDALAQWTRIAPLWDDHVGVIDFAAFEDDFDDDFDDDELEFDADELLDRGLGIFVDSGTAGQVTIGWGLVNHRDDSLVHSSVTLYESGEVRFDYGPGNVGLDPVVGISSGTGMYVLAPDHHGQANLAHAPSVQFEPEQSVVDLGAFEFQGEVTPLVPIEPIVPGAVALPAEVVGRHVFYNNSHFDGSGASPGPHNDAAIAVDKLALLPGQAAGFVNYTSYTRGLNGLIIDIADLADADAFGASDLVLRMGSDASLDQWTAAPPPLAHVRPGEGTGGSDRIELIWPDNTIENQWLEVMVKANDVTGLAEDDVFYFGHRAGDVTGDGQVTAEDISLIRQNQTGFGSAEIGNPHDITRSGRVDLGDVIATRNSQGTPLLEMITPPAQANGSLAPAQPASLGTMAESADTPATQPARSLTNTSLSALEPTSAATAVGQGHMPPPMFDALAALDGSPFSRPLDRATADWQPTRTGIGAMHDPLGSRSFGMAMDQSRLDLRLAPFLDDEQEEDEDDARWSPLIDGDESMVQIL